MLQIIVPAQELWDEGMQEFVQIKETALQLEHSLVSVSKWESKWLKPFLSKKPKSREEELDYVRCMTLSQNVNPKIYQYLTVKNLRDIGAYIDNPMTASTVAKSKQARNGEQTTSELIYYWMVAHQIPFDPCQKWHLNRLMMLIEICDAKNSPQKKMSPKELANHHRQINAARRAKNRKR